MAERLLPIFFSVISPWLEPFVEGSGGLCVASSVSISSLDDEGLLFFQKLLFQIGKLVLFASSKEHIFVAWFQFQVLADIMRQVYASWRVEIHCSLQPEVWDGSDDLFLLHIAPVARHLHDLELAAYVASLVAHLKLSAVDQDEGVLDLFYLGLLDV